MKKNHFNGSLFISVSFKMIFYIEFILENIFKRTISSSLVSKRLTSNFSHSYWNVSFATIVSPSHRPSLIPIPVVLAWAFRIKFILYNIYNTIYVHILKNSSAADDKVLIAALRSSSGLEALAVFRSLTYSRNHGDRALGIEYLRSKRTPWPLSPPSGIIMN